jgi:hypothetical protein
MQRPYLRQYGMMSPRKLIVPQSEARWILVIVVPYFVNDLQMDAVARPLPYVETALKIRS